MIRLNLIIKSMIVFLSIMLTKHFILKTIICFNLTLVIMILFLSLLSTYVIRRFKQISILVDIYRSNLD